MTTVDATAGESGRPAVVEEAPAAPAVVGPLAGDPSIFGLGVFIAGSVALGLGLVGVVPSGVLGAPLAIILAATALGLLMSAVWCAALGQSAVAAVFGIFGTFWLSYAVLVLGLDHSLVRHPRQRGAGHGEAVPAHLADRHRDADPGHAAAAVGLHRALRARRPRAAAPAARLGQASPLGVPSSGLLKTGGYVVLVFAALGVYLFFSASAAGTGGKPLPLGTPLMK